MKATTRQERHAHQTRSGIRAHLTRPLVVCLVPAMLAVGCVGGTDTNTDPQDGPQPGQPAKLTVLSQFGDTPALQRVLDDLNAN